MKSSRIVLSILISAAIVAPLGCKSRETAGKTKAVTASNSNVASVSKEPAQPTATNKNAEAMKASDTPSIPPPSVPAQLIGAYESREVEDKGVVTVVSQIRTLWVFSANGTYSRTSKVKGKTYHTDTGTFRIDPPNRIVLTIQMSGQDRARAKIQTPPVEKTHIYSLSPDAEELKLTSPRGSVATFRRIGRPRE